MGAHPLVQSPADLAALVAALPAGGALPVRTVLVATERHAHSLRRALASSGRAAALAGTRFVGPATLALELLREAGSDLRPGEEPLRPARILALLAEPLAFEYFDLALLRSTPGWPEAFASAIHDLEGAGLVPERLPRTTAAWRDLALLWRKLDEAAGTSATAARIYLRAAETLASGLRLPTGPILATITGREPAALARFLRALPGATLALAVARPLRERHLARVEALFGDAARTALASAPPPAPAATERDLLTRFLFASPALLAERDRPRSRGRDGTVELTEHAGVEEELEAAADWLARELLERETPLERIAVLVPAKGALPPLVAARLARLPWKDGPLPVYLAGGVPLVSRAGGARALALVRALAAWLPADRVAALIPALRAPRGERQHLSIEEAVALAWSLGTVGGNAGEPAKALDWPARAAAREAALAGEEEASAADGRTFHGRHDLERLRALRPALEALAALAKRVVEDAPLAELAPAFVAFVERWLLAPGGGAPLHVLIDEALAGARTDAVGAALRGPAALTLLEERLLSIRLPTARFGEPAVFVGTVAEAAGLELDAVRVIGLAEGTLPSAVREDPVLLDSMRLEADPLLVPVTADRVLAQLQSFDAALRATGRAFALSFPRNDLARSEREPSSLLVEVGAALGRHDPHHPGAIPDLASLARTALGPAREEALRFRAERPVGEVAWQDRASARGEIPPGWTAEPSVALGAILALRDATALGADTGLLGAAGPLGPIPGIDPERPISATALGTLLACPLRFLFTRLLGWDEPSGAPSLGELDPLTYGGLFHETMEELYAAHGADLVARKRSLAHWLAVAKALAAAKLDALLEQRPLVGKGVVEKERNRLHRDVERFLAYDWNLPLDRFIGVELPFGYDAPLALDAGGTPLHVHGFIDRIDVERGHALLRDLKTGRAHLREGEEEGPTAGRDLQLGLYGMVARRLSAELEIPKKLQAAYAYVQHGEERAFRGDYAELEAAAKGWLAISASLLASHQFPPTPDAGDCGWCPFRPVCGPEVPARAAAATARGPAGAFLKLRAPEEEEE
jgi:hypothetical protein